MRFTLPLEVLSLDPEERYQQLHNYFCDQRAKSFQENGHWVVETYWPPSHDYFVDPKIKEGLLWWDKSLDITNVHQEFRHMKGFNLSLNDSWTLYSWSNWIASFSLLDQFPDEVNVLHIDYHNDLMSPRLGYDNNKYFDLLTKENFSITNPVLVKKAILSGAIGVGSFIVPFLHEVKKVHIRHLCEGNILKKTNCHFKRHWERDSLLSLHTLRPTISKLSVTNTQNSNISYLITDNLYEWLIDLPNVPTLLHIDMDYFNCRYDGDSDWDKNLPRYDPSQELILRKIETIFKTLAASNVKDNLGDIAVAISPGFFPAEFWANSVHKVSEMVQMLK